MNLQQQEQFYQMMTRLKTHSRAGSVPKEDAIVTEIVNGLIVSKPAKKIEHISEAKTTSEPQAQVWNLTKDGPVLQKESKAASTQYETVVKKYDMSLPSTGDKVYRCGLHDYETRSLTEFNRHVEDHGSKAASVSVPTNKLKAIQDFINRGY
jgi:hypothetical protein